MKSSRLGVRPLHVLEHDHDWIGVGEPLEEEPPGARTGPRWARAGAPRARAGVPAAARRTARSSGSAPGIVEDVACNFASAAAGASSSRSGSASAPCPPAPSRSRPRRRQGSGRGATALICGRPSMYLKNSHTSRDLPIPAIPVTDTRCARLSSAQAWNSSLIWRSSRSRPTNGASSPSDLSAPRASRDDPHAPATAGASPTCPSARVARRPRTQPSARSRAGSTRPPAPRRARPATAPARRC